MLWVSLSKSQYVSYMIFSASGNSYTWGFLIGKLSFFQFVYHVHIRHHLSYLTTAFSHTDSKTVGALVWQDAWNGWKEHRRKRPSKAASFLFSW